jgi:hypothetical protein
VATEPLDESWKDARVRHAEQALADAVRTADEIIAAAERAIAMPDDPVPIEEPSEQTILRDAW